ncbi:hypothetical protein OnM2_056042 [Erysiphe neolycopersici]|uniref:Uncharacterized protein n=1 Tax=Erysiphe neolycopersici TaxID=212602 RepID=A0A420HQZ9_9PEZI|nr:hypothetical protein OnM2_056042 [Erysiphe neolycopersici]
MTQTRSRQRKERFRQEGNKADRQLSKQSGSEECNLHFTFVPNPLLLLTSLVTSSSRNKADEV